MNNILYNITNNNLKSNLYTASRCGQNKGNRKEVRKEIQEEIQGLTHHNEKTDSSTFSQIAADSSNYSKLLQTQRSSKQSTRLALRKINYDFKGISSQILRSKTSQSARNVAAKAKREVLRLKRKLSNGEYDEDELRLAISHAQAMERVAKKKAKHLLEEELIKVTGGVCLGEADDEKDILDNDISDKDNDVSSEYESESMPEISNQDMMFNMPEDFVDDYGEMLNEISDYLQENELFWDAYSELDEQLKEMLEEVGFEEPGATVYVGKEMDPTDYKALKQKHRHEEQKAIWKADGEYLKGMFKHYQEQRSQAAASNTAEAPVNFGVAADTASAGVTGFNVLI